MNLYETAFWSAASVITFEGAIYLSERLVLQYIEKINKNDAFVAAKKTLTIIDKNVLDKLYNSGRKIAAKHFLDNYNLQSQPAHI